MQDMQLVGSVSARRESGLIAPSLMFDQISGVRRSLRRAVHIKSDSFV